MKTLGLALVLALTSSAAYAGSGFEFRINGGVARISWADHCSRLRCASVNWAEKDRSGERKSARQSPRTETAADEPPAPVWNSAPPSVTAERAIPAAITTVEPPAPQSVPAPVPAPVVAQPAKPDTTPAAPVPAAAAPVLASAEQKVATLAPVPVARAATSPVGEWLVEDGVGRIRIEECGKNLCGVVSVAKNPNDTDHKNPDPALRKRPVVGVPILLDMKPGKANHWDGEIYNVENGRTYTAHAALKSPNTLRVEGCAFGGLFCGGQNWTRVN